MRSHSVEQLQADMESVRPVEFTLRVDERLERFQCLNCSLETDGAWLDIVVGRGLGHDGTNEIVSEEMCPDFLANQFRCLATQDVSPRKESAALE